MPHRLLGPAATGAAVVLLLCGCVAGAPASTPSAAPTPVPSTHAAPTPEADPLTTVTAIVVRPDAFELHDAEGGVVAVLDYLSPTADALATLTALFDAVPESEEFDGTSHFPPSTAHRWEGFELWEQRYVDQWADGERSLAHPEFLVRFAGAEALGIELASPDGRHVGEGWSSLLAEPAIRTVPSGCSGPYLDFVELDDVDSVSGTRMKVSVEFDPTSDESAIASISAPMPVYDDGCA